MNAQVDGYCCHPKLRCQTSGPILLLTLEPIKEVYTDGRTSCPPDVLNYCKRSQISDPTCPLRQHNRKHPKHTDDDRLLQRDLDDGDTQFVYREMLKPRLEFITVGSLRHEGNASSHVVSGLTIHHE